MIVRDAQILTNNRDMESSAYIKTWVGELVPQDSYESDYLPRGGGWYVQESYPLNLKEKTCLTRSPRGVVTNILFENFYIEGASVGPDINQDSGDNGMTLSLIPDCANRVTRVLTNERQICRQLRGNFEYARLQRSLCKFHWLGYQLVSHGCCVLFEQESVLQHR